MKARIQVLRNKFKCDWKYRRFSDQSIWGSLWQQIKGVIVIAARVAMGKKGFARIL